MALRSSSRTSCASRGGAIRAVFAGAALSLLAAVPRDAGAADAPPEVSLGEVSTSVQRGDLDLRALVRASFEEELRALDLGHAPHRRRAILSASLVRMDTLPSTDDIPVTTCVISATLRDARRGAVFAVLEGRARAGSPSDARAIVKVAVRGAVARIPEAMRHL